MVPFCRIPCQWIVVGAVAISLWTVISTTSPQLTSMASPGDFPFIARADWALPSKLSCASVILRSNFFKGAPEEKISSVSTLTDLPPHHELRLFGPLQMVSFNGAAVWVALLQDEMLVVVVVEVPFEKPVVVVVNAVVVIVPLPLFPPRDVVVSVLVVDPSPPE